MQIYELTKQSRLDEGLLDGVKKAVSAANTGLNKAADTANQLFFPNSPANALAAANPSKVTRQSQTTKNQQLVKSAQGKGYLTPPESYQDSIQQVQRNPEVKRLIDFLWPQFQKAFADNNFGSIQNPTTIPNTESPKAAGIKKLAVKKPLAKPTNTANTQNYGKGHISGKSYGVPNQANAYGTGIGKPADNLATALAEEWDIFEQDLYEAIPNVVPNKMSPGDLAKRSSQRNQKQPVQPANTASVNQPTRPTVKLATSPSAVKTPKKIATQPTIDKSNDVAPSANPSASLLQWMAKKITPQYSVKYAEKEADADLPGTAQKILDPNTTDQNRKMQFELFVQKAIAAALWKKYENIKDVASNTGDYASNPLDKINIDNFLKSIKNADARTKIALAKQIAPILGLREDSL